MRRANDQVSTISTDFSGGSNSKRLTTSFVQQRTVVDSTGGPHTARVKNKTEYEVAKNDSNANESKKKGIE